ncbi:MAG: hypothetical protein ACYDC1_22010 [Limisphaerales bacterium]
MSKLNFLMCGSFLTSGVLSERCSMEGPSFMSEASSIRAPTVETESHLSQDNAAFESTATDAIRMNILDDGPQVWTEGLERKFRRLAALEADRKATSNQLVELESMTVQRDRLLAQDVHSILAQIKHDRAIANLAAALDGHFKYINRESKNRSQEPS